MAIQNKSEHDLTKFGRTTYLQQFRLTLESYSLYILVRMIGLTTRFDVRGWENVEQVERENKLPIYAFWHDRMFLGFYFFRHRGIRALISQSRDGELLTRVIEKLGYKAIRGSSSKGGSGALAEMARSMSEGRAAAITVDGPRGPRHKAKIGPVILAKRTGNPIVPFVVKPERFRTTKSWDRMQIPMPFARAMVIIGKPIYVNENSDQSEIDSRHAELQRSLESITILADT